MIEKSSVAMPGRWRKPKQARSWVRVNRMLDVAEALFVEQGYAAATTKQIAAEADVPIGTLYQFFPDKAAILEALAERYTNLLIERMQVFETPEMIELPLEDYVKRFMEGIDAFFTESPGYRATFIEITTAMPEVDQAGDDLLMQAYKRILLKLNDALTDDDCEAIAFLMIKAVGNLVWSASGQPPEFRQRLLLEAEKLSLNYLKSYVPEA